MKVYWDSSALVEACQNTSARQRLSGDRGFGRRHALAEVFAAMSDKPHLRVAPSQVVLVLKDIVADLDFVELTTDDIIKAASDAQSLGVRGGAIHDLLHVRAAVKAGATEILTLDRNDFLNLVPAGLSIGQL
jgi:hypothetical protein